VLRRVRKSTAVVSLNDPHWQVFRDELVALARSGDHDWLDAEDIQQVLGDAYRKGLPPRLIISCRAAAASGHAEFASELESLVRKTKVRVLAIDDEKGFLNLLRLNLERAGNYEVRTESDPLNWRAALDAFTPHLLILDMVMPGVDGREILRELATQIGGRPLPIIVLTAVLENSAAGAVNREGILYLAKPVSLKALLHCIEEHLEAVGIR